MPDDWLDKLVGLEVEELYLAVLSPCNHHVVDAVYFYFVYLWQRVHILPEVLACFTVFSWQVGNLTLFLACFGIEQRYDIFAVAYCKLWVARQPTSTRRRQKVAKLSDLTESTQKVLGGIIHCFVRLWIHWRLILCWSLPHSYGWVRAYWKQISFWVQF